MKIKEFVVLFIISSISYFCGLNWGLPSKSLNKLYFNDIETIEKHIEQIKKYPIEKIYKGMGPYLAKYPEVEKEKLPRFYYNPIRSYHPDEYYVIKSFSSMKPEKFDFNPHAYSIGGAYLYLVGLFLFLFSKLNFVVLSKDICFYFLHPEEIGKFYIIGRAITAIYGIGIILLSYLLCKKFFKDGLKSFLICLLILFSPLIILNSHYMYVDIPGLFWITACLFITSNSIEKFSFKNVFLAGIFAGLACGTKITFVVSIVIPLLGIFIIFKNPKDIVKNFLLVVICFIFSFFITNPYFFLTFPEPLIELEQHTGLSFNGKFYFLSLKYGLGFPLLIFALTGTLLSIFFIKERSDLEKKLLFLLFSWTVFFFIFISIFSKNFARYILPLVPSFIILGGYGWFLTLTKTKKILKFLISLWIIFVILFTFFYGMSYEMLFIQKNIRTEAGEWIKENIPAGSSIGVTEVPWQFQMPPFDYFKYNLIVTGYDFNKLKKEKPEYFIISSFQAPIPPFPLKLQIEKNSFWNEFINSSIYKEEKKFQKFPSFLSFKFQFNELPEDLIYLNPTIVIFKYKNETF
ncbi:MAG TPA: glycosyltransferase family 39 protein [bacterium]|nr:glycosyltransferase family 39 protein [bacterium]